MFQKILDEAMAGDDVGLLLRGIQKNDTQRGMLMPDPLLVLYNSQSHQCASDATSFKFCSFISPPPMSASSLKVALLE
ncbi:hypothetical protein Fmac_009453 [Flemingia macrophylla]|uniref:Uncharacterized protein n=1 Tax=Flemingia macrophylla TaxID=520843 RepID=A0ABD1N0E1_9FABA